MNLNRSRGFPATQVVVLAVVLATLGVSLGVARSASAAEPSSEQIAKECAGHTSVSEHLSYADVAFLKTYVPCVASKSRATGAGAFDVSGQLSSIAASDLAADAKRSGTGVVAADRQQGVAADKTVCHNQRHSGLLWLDSSPPPTLTPLVIAHYLDGYMNKTSQSWDLTSGAAFGFAYGRDVLYGDTPVSDPVAIMTLQVKC